MKDYERLCKITPVFDNFKSSKFKDFASALVLPFNISNTYKKTVVQQFNLTAGGFTFIFVPF